MEPRTRKRKYCKTFDAKRESGLLCYRCKRDSQALALCCTLCSAHLQ
jgi:hypothetical protein